MATGIDGKTAESDSLAVKRFADPRWAVGRGKCVSMAFVALLALAVLLSSGATDAQPLQILIERLDRLERENRQLRKEIDELMAARSVTTKPADMPRESKGSGYVRLNSAYGYAVLDPTADINRKQRLILDRKRQGTLAPDSVHLHGAVTAIANFQTSNRADKFGYLMRHPTASNQVGKEVSEAAIHSAQLGFTAQLGNWIVGHAATLFDPEQSFGEGTNTDLERNQVQVRRAYVLFGDLARAPIFASLGKMAVPFGLTDTVNPFTASTVWHAFGGLANGATVGYADERMNLTAMAIQGGSQFRAANAPVEDTNVPSRLNNFALDANYTFRLGRGGTLLVGGSYLHGSAYCQDFPIAHFMACRDNNPAYDVYGRLVLDDLTLKGEFARTIDVWPGTFNQGMPRFKASKVTSFDIGARYRLASDRGPFDLSVEFSRFVAGPDGAPWEKQDQFVVGAAWFVRPSVKLFAEYIRVHGFAPLNFLSGGSVRDADGNVIPNRTVSDASTRSNVFLLGVTAAF
ncbi:MAG: hypothetical protein OXF79_28210 [Chloroflexi bacterium]|nr:hypothetical protein [Chloroflexota bacterium]